MYINRSDLTLILSDYKPQAQTVPEPEGLGDRFWPGVHLGTESRGGGGWAAAPLKVRHAASADTVVPKANGGRKLRSCGNTGWI